MGRMKELPARACESTSDGLRPRTEDVQPVDTPQPLLLRDKDVADILNVSRAMVHKLRGQGQLPEPVRLGRSVRWRRAELEAWIEQGCPPIDKWRYPKDRRGSEGGRTTRPQH